MAPGALAYVCVTEPSGTADALLGRITTASRDATVQTTPVQRP